MNYPRLVTILGIAIGIILVSLTYSGNFVENRTVSLESFMLIHFLGYLFFILMPVEGIFIYYLTQSYNWTLLIAAATITALFGQIVDYLLGKLVSEKFAKDLIGRNKYKKTKDIIYKYGNLIIFVFSLSLLSSPIVVFITGIVRYDWKKVFLYSFLGLFTKYVLITGFYYMF